ncbi:hypothetical protein BASA50_009581 [Batrachochytrium salamandrivorans]|uniref:Uncharacterized protein n=1 Tax=Batrachochytrium salamandrivorans TaxID=1357716 RepID=A0ABQ8F3T9_9FUNG|nr:hypothetical protein BASA60_009163 [Batrachochytrium salamandrivorans]KAH6568865.1 hypothetical protein BASA62_005232 [Batrachochytrium salamandrivorans]KAH6590168.1 hypothetical protein BASA50_009581 [Batrachochytrium salamandrivorans]KAH9266439.1 hypothetical protein BASA83_010557 [Batrachochytrium salamandrivorans]
MKLISVAVISFLAITVSADPHRSAASQGLEESQIDLVHSVNGQYLQLLQVELNELLDNYKAKKDEADKLQDIIDAMEKEVSDLESRASDLDDPEKKASAQNLSNLQISLEEAKEFKSTLEDEMDAAMEEYGDTVEEIVSLGGVPK